MTIGLRRDVQIPTTPGPGHFSLEKADGIVNDRAPAWEWHKNQGRPEPAIDPSNGPGTTIDNRKFGDDAHNMTIGLRRDAQIPTTPGPGHFSHEKADGLVNDRAPAWEWHKNQGRPEPAIDPSNGPGTTIDNRKFGDDAHNMTIGLRRDAQIPTTPGPGHFSHEKADGLVNDRAPAWEWHKNQGRPEPAIDCENGPGSFMDYRKFGDGANKLTIGVKRDLVFTVTPGPCDYSPERADRLVRPNSPIKTIKVSPSKYESEPSPGPGYYSVKSTTLCDAEM
jgi:poly(3-hydroxybutyrate) depolymerase